LQRFNHLVGGLEQLVGHVEAERAGGLTRSAKAVSGLLDARIPRLKPVIVELLRKDYVAANDTPSDNAFCRVAPLVLYIIPQWTSCIMSALTIRSS
jgi:hypothetical protein